METFRRSEKKYLLDQGSYEKLMDLLKEYIVPDKFHETAVNSIYYDTDDHQLIRRSIEKPEYKEKLRVRSYKDADEDDAVFLEFKKKLDGVVYKRRTKAACGEVLSDISHCRFDDEQVGKEIRYALNYYGNLSPRIYIGSIRTSFAAKDDERIRITFDQDLRYRMKDLSLKRSKDDKRLTDQIVMELKVPEAMPLWLSHILDETKAYPRGFSKVGTAYLRELRGDQL